MTSATTGTDRAAATIARQLAPWLAFGGLLATLPILLPSAVSITILNQMGIAVIFALSYNLLFGQSGMLSFGHAVYFGLGGFFAVHLMNWIELESWWLPLPLLPLFGGLFGLAFAVVIGSFSTRRAGTAFAMISLGIGELIAACSIIFVFFFGGEEGVSADRTRGPTIFGHRFVTEIEVYCLTAAFVFLSTGLMYLFSRTPAGRMANAVRDNPERVAFIGYCQRVVRFISFCASGLFAGVAGSLFAINYEIVTEENLNLATSSWVLLMVYVGGAGYFIGPMIGAVLLTLLQTVISHHTEIWRLYLGILFLLTVVYAPNGLTGLVMMHGPAFKTGRLPGLLHAYARSAPPLLALLCGAVACLELAHCIKESGNNEAIWHLLGYPVRAASPPPWIIAVGMVLYGVHGIRARLADLHAAWDRAHAPASTL